MTPSLSCKSVRVEFSQQRQNIESNSNLMSALACHFSHHSPYVRSVLSTAVCQNREIKDLGKKGLCFKIFTGFRHTFKHISQTHIKQVYVHSLPHLSAIFRRQLRKFPKEFPKTPYVK